MLQILGDGKRGLTRRDGLDTTSPGEQVRTEDANKDRDAERRGEPADEVANEVDLLLPLVLRPEADAADEEGPIDRVAGIGMRSGKARIVLQHEKLQFGEFFEKVTLLWFSQGHLGSAFRETLLILRIDERVNEPDGCTLL